MCTQKELCRDDRCMAAHPFVRVNRYGCICPFAEDSPVRPGQSMNRSRSAYQIDSIEPMRKPGWDPSIRWDRGSCGGDILQGGLKNPCTSAHAGLMP